MGVLGCTHLCSLKHKKKGLLAMHKKDVDVNLKLSTFVAGKNVYVIGPLAKANSDQYFRKGMYARVWSCLERPNSKAY